jgi:hypothetical protein
MLVCWYVFVVHADATFFGWKIIKIRFRDTESVTLCINSAQSRPLSPYQQCAESVTLRINDALSQRLSISTMRRVGDSPYQ